MFGGGFCEPRSYHSFASSNMELATAVIFDSDILALNSNDGSMFT